MNWRPLAVLLLSCGGTIAPAGAAQDHAGDALGILLAATALPIPAGSSCDTPLPARPDRTLGAVLADKLAGFAAGSNRITGGCDQGRCRVVLTHEGGEEDLFQYEYRFRAVRGRLVPGSLSCFGT